MKLALLMLQGQSVTRNELAMRRQIVEMEQALALLRHMRDGGEFAPYLFCQKDSYIHDRAMQQNLPVISLKNGYCLRDRFILWRWQRQFPDLIILALGGKSLACAEKLRRMRGKKNTPLMPVFFCWPEELHKKELKFLARCSGLVAGSSLIRDRLEKFMSQCNLSLPEQWHLLPPGINLKAYATGRTDGEIKGRHFIFGMAESLQPRSGALLVLRSMAAIWQKENLPDWEVRMYGAGPRFDEIYEEARSLGVLSRLAILAEQDLVNASSLCDCWLAPGSAEDELPVTLWGAFGSGITLISSRSPLHLERLALTPDSALLVENNPQTLAQAMIAVMQEKSLRVDLCAKAIAARPCAGTDNMAQHMLELLDGLVSEKANSEQARSES